MAGGWSYRWTSAKYQGGIAKWTGTPLSVSTPLPTGATAFRWYASCTVTLAYETEDTTYRSPVALWFEVQALLNGVGRELHSEGLTCVPQVESWLTADVPGVRRYLVSAGYWATLAPAGGRVAQLTGSSATLVGKLTVPSRPNGYPDPQSSSVFFQVALLTGVRT